MKRRHILVALASAQLVAAGTALAQPADLPIPAAASDERPAGVSVAKAKNGGNVYVDAEGRTLYGMDLRAIVSRTANGAKYCQGPCLEEWEPLMAPEGTKADASIGANPLQNLQGLGGGGGGQGAPQGAAAAAQARGAGGAPGAAAPGQGQGGQGQGGGNNIIGSSTGVQQVVNDWSVVEGPKGPQYVYKRWHLVFTRKGDKRAQTDRDGYDKYVWNTLKYLPPVPKLVAPTTVSTTLKDGTYVLTDKQGAVLFTGNCTKNCHWVPLQAGAAGRGLGEWTVSRSGDTPQWVYRGKPVFVSQEEDPLQTPASGTALQP